VEQAVSKNQRVTDAKVRLARQLRRQATPSETVLWEALRGRKLAGLKFRRQQLVRGFVADLYCEEKDLAVEIDGAYHLDPAVQAKDAERDEVFAAAHVRVLRVTVDEVLRDLPAVLQKILRAA